METMGKVTDQIGDIADANLQALKDVTPPVLAKAAATGRRKTA